MIFLLLFSCSNKNEVVYSTYDDGQPKLVGYPKGNGKECFEVFYDDGALKSTFCTINELYDGKYNTYYRNGKIQSSESYEMGLSVGNVRTYHRSGSIRENYLKRGRYRNGEYLAYDSLGRDSLVRYYEEGIKYYEMAMRYDSLNEQHLQEHLDVITRVEKSPESDFACVSLVLPSMASMELVADSLFVSYNIATLPIEQELIDTGHFVPIGVNYRVSRCPRTGLTCDSLVVYGSLIVVGEMNDTVWLSSYEQVLSREKN